ncbi:MAG: 4-hydroxy-tetrahydrodipicolinate reductase [Candidatus Wallbacteria bacterium]
MKNIKVAVSGACGRMGKTAIEAVNADPALDLSGLIDINEIGASYYGIKVTNEIKQTNFREKTDVLIEFTHPKSVFENIKKALSENLHCVVGTTGLAEAQLKEIEKMALDKNLGVLIAPNFAIGAVLMMKFAQIAAKYMKSAEIIELHHDKKADSPSGTALLTAKMICENIKPQIKNPDIINLGGVRGGIMKGAGGGEVNVHSLRLPGLVAHQEVIFGDIGQTLTIRHDSLSRESFMPGVVMAVKEIVKRKGLIIGLENIMEGF